MKQVFGAFLLLMIFMLGSVSAEPFTTLVKEKSEQEFGLQMPTNGQFEIKLFNTEDFDAHLITDFQLDKNSGQFIASAIREDGKETRVAGLSMLTISVPVPVRRIMPDEIISEEDVVMDKILQGRVGVFSIQNKDDLLGKQSRRMLAQGRPVAEQSVTPPIIIDKGERVEIVYTDGDMTLRAPGKALDEAYKGKEIRIVNLISNKTLVGIAQSQDRVEILN